MAVFSFHWLSLIWSFLFCMECWLCLSGITTNANTFLSVQFSGATFPVALYAVCYPDSQFHSFYQYFSFSGSACYFFQYFYYGYRTDIYFSSLGNHSCADWLWNAVFNFILLHENTWKFFLRLVWIRYGERKYSYNTQFRNSSENS